MSKSDFLLEDPTGELTDRQKLFCNNYIISKFNGTEAAKMSGYSHNTSAEQASRLLSNVNIQAYVDLLKKDLGLRLGITKERIALELAKIAFYDPRKMLTVDGGLKPINELDDDTAGAIGGIELFEVTAGDEDRISIGVNKKIKIWDKRAALCDLNKMFGYDMPLKISPTDPEGKPIAVTLNLG